MLVRFREGMVLGDLLHLGRAESIATALVDTGDGIGIVDPGPSSCRDVLQEILRDWGAGFEDVRHVFLTHIHLDHAGVTGSLLQATPRAQVYVHARGAPHMADPTRLLESAGRIYGEDMDRLWGEFLPVPRDRITVLDGGERLTIGFRRWRVAATPGHAVHHVAYLDERDGVVFAGGVAGEATQHGTPALPVAPPPDIDLESWRPSLDRILEWRPESLFLTHFGEVHEPRGHIEEMWARLVEWSELVRASLDQPGTDEERADAFFQQVWDELTATMPPERTTWVERDAIRSSWFGLARYWRKRNGPLTPPQPIAPQAPLSPQGPHVP